MTGIRSARRRVWVWDLPGRPHIITDDVRYWRTAYLRRAWDWNWKPDGRGGWWSGPGEPPELVPNPDHACAAHDDAHLGQPCPDRTVTAPATCTRVGFHNCAAAGAWRNHDRVDDGIDGKVAPEVGSPATAPYSSGGEVK